MPLSTMYLIALFIVPAALGAVLLTLLSVDELRSKAGRSQQPAADQQFVRHQPYLATGSELELPGFGALHHRGATQ